MRNFTLAECVRLIRLGNAIKDTEDEQLGELVCQLAKDDSVLPAIHDRLNVLGRFKDADRILAWVKQE